MALPPLTPEQRSAALVKAAEARQERAVVKNRLKNRLASLEEVLKEGQTNDVVGKMKVSALLESMPKVGKVRAREIMERIGIAETESHTSGWSSRSREMTVVFPTPEGPDSTVSRGRTDPGDPS